ncbi:MAG: DUF167 domain-containing protein [Chloroflexi bacterium]|nr:DUF167 domain-containing protein [Chloroflexota bacterium]MBI1854639.1 DUF167 domain-containing protein [Chloroflexota bacterium]MBI2759217.1 DUF167 domain-containing protein [Chloroflexota bacterium]MBI3341124.1 DUF167 domain-containing protein [Chloroflexota bacterium]
MPRRNFHLHDGKKGSALAVRVTPRASRNKIVEVMIDGTVKIHLSAPPVDGEANEKLVEFLSEVLGTPKSRIEIVAGAAGRDKLVSVLDMDADAVHKRIVAHLE